MKAEIVDFNYEDISYTRLKRGVFSSEIYLKARYHSDEVKLPAVSKQVGTQLHAMIQKGIRGELAGQKRHRSDHTEEEDDNKNHVRGVTTTIENKPKEEEADLFGEIRKYSKYETERDYSR